MAKPQAEMPSCTTSPLFHLQSMIREIRFDELNSIPYSRLTGSCALSFDRQLSTAPNVRPEKRRRTQQHHAHGVLRANSATQPASAEAALLGIIQTRDLNRQQSRTNRLLRIRDKCRDVGVVARQAIRDRGNFVQMCIGTRRVRERRAGKV